MTDVSKKRRLIPGDAGESVYDLNLFLTDAQLQAEYEKCEYCADKPCKEACPCDCSPADFIKAAYVGEASDIARAAALIMTMNPLGGICGQTCPEKHCMSACVHKKFDSAVNIPKVQATIIEKAKRLGVMPRLADPESNGKRIAIVGSGPTGLGAGALLSRRGYSVTIFEKGPEPGGMCNLIPDFRLDREVLKTDIDWTLRLGNIELQTNAEVRNPGELLEKGYDAVIVAAGLWEPIYPGILNEDKAIPGIPFLASPADYDVSGNVGIIGGGATAFDCGMTALLHGAGRVELFALENLSEMPLTNREMGELVNSGIDVNGRIQAQSILMNNGDIYGLSLVKVRLKEGRKFAPDAVEPIPGSEVVRNDIDRIIIAIGAKPGVPRTDEPGIFYAGDFLEGPTTVVEASAAGKNAAEQVDCYLEGKDVPEFKRDERGHVKSEIQIPGYNFEPVSLETDFFGKTISSPFLLSASPLTDGLEQMKKAYEAGWPGAIMKTAFDGAAIHIPAEYMYEFTERTYANCDNVSGHPLDRVCREVKELVEQYPDRMTIASTGGPVTGDDEADKRGWQGNTKKLEDAGVMAIEYSLSCPQGGDGTEGDIVSQNAELSAKIIDWVMDAGRGNVPKIFKLTGAVTSIEAILKEIKKVFERYPDKKAGVTLANTFPTMAFQKGEKENWEEGVVVGMAGEGALNISYLSLAKAAPLGIEISGNGGPMDYKQAADFLALGCRTVQFCSMPTVNGYAVIDELKSGLSHLMAHRGIDSVQKLTGIALPDPIRDFMELSADKKISQVDEEICVQCGNCRRCPYLAISYNDEGFPETDASKCIGCRMCNFMCFVGALSMRERTPEEAAALKED